MSRQKCDKLAQHFKDHDKVRVLEAHTAKVHSVAWNSDGHRLASGSFDRTVCVFTLDNSRLSRDHSCRGHTDQVDQLCWHKTNPDVLASAGGDKTVRVWDAKSRKCMATVNTKGENINIAWSPDGNTIAVGNKADLVSFVDVRTYKIIASEQFKVETNEFSWNLNNNLFFVTNGLGQIIIMSWPDLKTLLTVQAHPSNCICIEFSPDGQHFAIGSSDALVSYWDARNIVCLRTFNRADWPVRTISFSHDNLMLASGSEDLSIDIAFVETGEKVCDIKIENPTFTLAWHPKEHLLAFACDDKVVNSSYTRNEREAGTVKVYGFSADQI